MSLNLGVMSAAVTLDDADYRKKLSGIEGASSDTFKRIALAAAGYLTLRSIFGFVTGAMSEFSRLEEGNNKLKYTYTELREEAQRAADTIAKTFGLSAQTATNAIADIGDLLTGLGFEQREALNFAKSITERGIDVASFKGLDQTETIRRMTVALTGETESLKTMGIVVRQGSAEFQERVKSIMATTGATETMAKAQAILAEIMVQTDNAKGDYLRPDAARTYQQEVTDLTEAMRRFKAEVGASVQPITQDMVVNARKLLTWYNELTPSSRKLTNATAGLAAAMLVLTNTKVGRSIMSAGKSSAQGDVEAAKFQANEKVKQAETEMTTAVMEKTLAEQNLALAKNGVAAAENAEKFAQAELVRAQASGDQSKILQAQNALLTAQKNVTEAKLKEAKATSELNAKTMAANTATEKYQQLTSALPGVLKAISFSSTIAGHASIFMAGGIRAAAASVKSFWVSLGPLGWVILAIVGFIEAYNLVAAKMREEVDATAKSTAAAKEEASKMAEVLNAGDQTRSADLSKIERLKELAKYERLNRDEISEAKKLNLELAKSYGVTIGTINDATGALELQGGAMDDLINKMKQQRKLELEAKADAEKNTLAALRAEKQALFEEKRMIGQEVYYYARSLFGGKSEDEERSEAIEAKDNEILVQMKKAAAARMELENSNSVAGDEAMVAKSKRQQQDASDKAKSEIEGVRWQHRFDKSDSAGKTAMLDDKLTEKRSALWDRAGNKSEADYTPEELGQLKEIISLEQKREEIVKRRLDELQRSGDTPTYDKLLQDELDRATKSAIQMKRQYELALADAQEDGEITEEERSRIDAAKRSLDEASELANDYALRQVGGANDASKREAKTVGGFSLKTLGLQLGKNSAAEDTAKNTRETAKLLRELKNEGLLSADNITYAD